MKVYDVVQGSSAWMELRMGRPTASQADRIITPGGAPSKSALGYIHELIAEILLRRPLLGVLTGPMQRGKEIEAEAITYYELMRDTETTVVGFVTSDDGRIGASPDRFVEPAGIVEIKAPLETTQSKYLSAHIDALLGEGNGEGGPATVYRCQVQYQLFVCEREWCDIMSYFPGLPEVITRVGRDEPFIAKLKAELAKFLEMFDARLEKLRQLGYLDSGAAPARAAKAQPGPDDVDVFGLTESDVNDWVAKLKQEGAL